MYETEQEQIEAIKKWWNQYGNWIIGGFLSALIAYFGWSYYQSSTQARQEAASLVYEELVVSVDRDGPASERRALIDTLKSDYGRTTYAVYGALIAAADAANAGDFSGASAELDWALGQASAELRPVIQVRKARIQYANDELDAALSTLDQVSQSGFQVVVNELRGDILADLGQYDLARSAYEAAFAQSQEEGVSTPFLEIKLNDLASYASDS